MYDAINHFFLTIEMPKQWKDSSIVLLPKKANLTIPTNYYPISLCNMIYKIVAKILIDWLKVILPQLISQKQGALISNRQITTNVLLAQELVHSIWLMLCGQKV